jgi:putative mRNA 3-end processing factor
VDWRVVRVEFQHADPSEGNESVLLRFAREGAENACLLVDAGEGVDLDALSRPGDALAGVLLTHAHLDHYGSLVENHPPGVPVYTSPATAAILPRVLSVARDEYGVGPPDRVLDALEPVDGWVEAAPGVRVRPVPAGHAPGAVGFLVRFPDDAGVDHTIALTGDFTLEHAVGRRGFPTDLPVDVEALFLTGVTDESVAENLGEALGVALERARGGSRTLVTASGLTGVHVAYLLSRLADRIGHRTRVVLAGQAAKVYDALDRRFPGVESVPVFRRTEEVLAEGAVTVAGPEVPRERSSGRLFHELADAPAACVVQLVGSGRSPVRSAGCTVHDYTVSNHASEADLQRLVDALDPGEVVVTHVHGGVQGRYNHLTDGVVWGKGDTAPATLFADGAWRTPPWMATDRLRGEFGAAAERTDGGSVLDLAPDSEATLADEPIDLATFDEVVCHGGGQPSGDDLRSARTEMTTDGDRETRDEERSDDETRGEGCLYETTRTGADPPPDPTDRLRDPPPGDLVTAFARAQLRTEDEPADEAVASSAPEETVASCPADEEPTPASTTTRSEADATTLADLCPPLDPLVVDLLAHAAAGRSDAPDDPAAVLDAAVERYLGRRLSNADHRTDPLDATLSLAGSTPLVSAAEEAVSAGDGLCVDGAVRVGLRATLSHDAPATDTTAVRVPEPTMLSAVVDADDTGFESLADVLAVAAVSMLAPE